MDDPLPPSAGPAAYMTSRGRQRRPASTTLDSLARQHQQQLRTTDDLIQNLTPHTAAEYLQNPAGTLKTCIDSATPSEQAFAMRAAIASKKIAEWLEELVSWPWPAQGGSSGFELPASKRRRLSSLDGDVPLKTPGPPLLEDDVDYIGSIPAADVVRYEKRIDEITLGLDGLDIEEIKTQVLHNHIMPLSRPGTPLIDSGRSVTSALSTLARMDDLTALITATLMQALPNLSKLTRLMSVWSFRLLVLRKIPVFLKSLSDAEAALRSGWMPTHLGSKGNVDDDPETSPSRQPAVLSPKSYEVKKAGLERKVAKAGRDLDSMLDILEGHQDTLPESWIDRVDSLEQEYGEWIAACERRLREAQLARIAETPELEADSGDHEESSNDDDTPSKKPASRSSSGPHPDDNRVQFLKRLFDASVPVKKPVIKVIRPSDEAPANRDPRVISVEPITPIIHTETTSLQAVPDGKLDEYKEQHLAFNGLQESSLPRHNPHGEQTEKDAEPKEGSLERARREIPGYDSDTSDGYVSEPELPVLPRPRRSSDDTVSSTVDHEPLADFSDFSTDHLDHGTPDRFSRRDLNFEISPASEIRAPSSPPTFRSGTRSMSVSFNDEPIVTRLPSFSSSPKTPQTPSIFDDETPASTGSPKVVLSNTDAQLQQQISEILESVPAKIRLSSGLPTVNLNPPDFKMPLVRRVSKPELHRSYSSMSTRSTGSRAGTPSFTLAPAYGRQVRQRPKPGNPEIKLYHLSRSNGEAPIKLFIRCVGEGGERVMVRVGGGWADLGEYLKEYASHHGRRSAGGEGRVEVKDIPRNAAASAAAIVRPGSTPPSRPASAQDTHSSMGPLKVRKTRRHTGIGSTTTTEEAKTPLSTTSKPDSNTTPSSGASTRSRSSSRLSWGEEDSSLGMAGPRAKQIEMSEENKAWVESVKEKVRRASGERKISAGSSAISPDMSSLLMDGKFGEIGKVGATKRLFRRQG